jgi:hypothetical protein
MIFGSKGQFDPWWLLARPVICPVSNEAQTGSLGAFDILSNELLDMIIENLEDRSDIIALGLCCEAFWQLIKRHIERSYIEAAAPWAGTKIAFQGSYCYDLPKPFLENGILESIVPQGARYFDPAWGKYRRFYWAHEKFESPGSPRDNLQAWLRAAEGHRGRSGIPAIRWGGLEKEMECSELFPKDRPWVLRNLTTRETVSSKMNGTSMRRGWNERAEIKFENVLMMRICWTSTLNSVQTQFEKLGLHRGAWAGHSFDIVTSEVHFQEENLDEWRDITREVALEIVALKAILPRTVEEEIAAWGALLQSLQSQQPWNSFDVRTLSSRVKHKQ